MTAILRKNLNFTEILKILQLIKIGNSSDVFLSATVLNLLRLKNHFVNVVSVRGPPLKIVPLAHCG